MTKQERIKRLSEAIEAVPEEKKDYILGIAEGMAVMKRLEKEKFADEAEQKAGYGDARVSGNAWVYGNAEVFNTRHFFVQGPIGSRDGYVTFYRTKDDTVEVRCGCFSGSLQEFVNQVEETHGGSRYEKEYKLAAELAKVCIRLEGESR